MHIRSLSLLLLAAVAGTACGPRDLTLADPGRAPANARPVLSSDYCVQFNVPPLNATFGAPVGTVPGSLVWIETGIRVSVNNFTTGTGGTAYNSLRIESPPAAFTLGAGKTGHANNISLGFDFTFLPIVPHTVRFQFLHQGGVENLGVNGSPVFVGQLTAPPATINGVSVISSWAPVAGGSQGTVSLGGGPAIANVKIGGQFLWLESVCAYP
jgi:hypothetical protein